MKETTIQTHRRTEFIDITQEVERFVRERDMVAGRVTVYVPHTTAGITINENADPDVMADLQAILERLVPWQGDYRHGEGNAAAHAKASMMGSSVQVLVQDGRVCRGTWQGIYFCEFDGPRSRKVWIHGD
jgi:secondary thiamine-phosphate synthase enzyme